MVSEEKKHNLLFALLQNIFDGPRRDDLCVKKSVGLAAVNCP